MIERTDVTDQTRVRRRYNLAAPVGDSLIAQPQLAAYAIEQWAQRLTAEGGEPAGWLKVTYRPAAPQSGTPAMVVVVGEALIPEELADRLDAEDEWESTRHLREPADRYRQPPPNA